MELAVKQFSANNILSNNEKSPLKNSYTKNTMICYKVSFSASPKSAKPSFIKTLKTKLTGLLPKKSAQGKSLTPQEMEEISKQLGKGKVREVSWKDFMGEE